MQVLKNAISQWIRTYNSTNANLNHVEMCRCAWNCYRNKFSWQFKQLNSGVGERLDVFVDIVSKQCNAIAAQRLRRTIQIFNLYSKLYSERSLKKVIESFRHSVLKRRYLKGKPLFALLGASIFSWERDQITDSEINGCIEDAEHIQRLWKSTGKLGICADTSLALNIVDSNIYMDQWENVIDRSHLQVWRRPLDSSYLYEYKATDLVCWENAVVSIPGGIDSQLCGSFYDLPARAFFNVQMNVDYRKEWDRLVIKLDVIDRDVEKSSDVVHWITHFPYPMYSRDYVYIRRWHWDEVNNVMVLSSRAVDHPSRPMDESYVRVTRYTSNMVIKPHASFDENGFDYVLTYHDDPQSNFPTFAYKWMASTGVPDFVDKLHCAALTLNERSKCRRIQNDQTRPKVQSDPRSPLPQYS